MALWALLQSLTPRVLAPDEVRPLIMLGTERLADGRLLSRARFETGPTLAAVSALAVALAALGLLRRHWRDARLERPRPEQPIGESRTVLGLGLASLGVYGLRFLVERLGNLSATVYVPILGGLLELAALFYFWMAVLQAWRGSRPLRREWPLWSGAALALIPPVVDLTVYILTTAP